MAAQPFHVLKNLPSMTALLANAEAHRRFAHHARAEWKAALTEALADARDALLAGAAVDEHASTDALVLAAIRRLDHRARSRLHRVINATGIVLHTGLGRAPLADAARLAIQNAAGYCNLEFNLERGDRGRRGVQLEDMLVRLTGAQAALVVNNNAAATLLALAGIAAGREAIVSRGQLVEIGGSFRLPDVMACSGCRMREVGTTNKTRLSDYESAITAETALILHVHTSNFRVMGFSESPGIAELAALAHARELIVYDDLGSGALLDDDLWRAANEPTVAASLAVGADIVSFSGDKLLGGPQAGVILGRADLIERLRRHPLARAMRIDKLTIAALQVTLELYFDPARAAAEVPALRLLNQPLDVLRPRAESLRQRLAAALADEAFEAAEDETFAGGGSLPVWPLPTAIVRWRLAANASADELARALRGADPPVVARIDSDAIVFDVRTLADDELDFVVAAARACRA